MECTICGRPIKNGGPYCQQHAREVDKERQERRARERKDAFRYVYYCDHVISLREDGDGALKASYVGMSLSGIPKSRLINLTTYCDGYSRQQIKKLKALVLRLARI